MPSGRRTKPEENKMDTSSQHFFRDNPRSVTLLLGASIAIKVALIFIFAWHIRLIMDEFAQLGYAKYFANGLFDTIQPPKAVGFAVFYKLAHLIGWNAASIIHIGRMQMALLACATLLLVYACARALGEQRLRSLLIVLVLLCFTNFMERIFRTRSEPLALFFALAAMLVILRGPTLNARKIFIAGILSGLAFLVTQKSAFFNLALGLGLVVDATLRKDVITALVRGFYLTVGWLFPAMVYCLIFGGSDPLRIADGLIFGPLEVAVSGSEAYSGALRTFVLQTLMENAWLYLLCFSGMAIAVKRFRVLHEKNRIALIFSLVITTLVFTHSQPWPYVFIMALPFLSLWSLAPLDVLFAHHRKPSLRLFMLAVAIFLLLSSYRTNFSYLKISNVRQLELVSRAEALLKPDEKYFDGIGILPNRLEPTTLWLDTWYVLKTLREGKSSEAWQVLTQSPPKIVLWSYRLSNIYPAIADAIDNSYVQVAPNIRMMGQRVHLDRQVVYKVPLAGRYQLYSETGAPISAQINVDGIALVPPITLSTGRKIITLLNGPKQALLLPEGTYTGLFKEGEDNQDLFANAYYR
ncbi:hypothetical protein HII27_22495 [Kluyvera sp. SCKS090646]|uniref:Glycosyltransferase RgtA/B/C/D-like domain-containing protein n=1 Tax=Kluyvera sichuanensis TaxID=2725494 RepID=A0ABR6RZJ1_9ENTR|nr:hypothetical protein [Kluyvera sichuanensis]MBC1188465.1 hypothetical protein [Kluyvera sichuanensis]